MALFGKKSGDSSSGGTTTAKPGKEKQGGLFGRKKGGNADAGAPPAAGDTGGFEDFSDFSAASSELGFSAAPLNTIAPRSKVLNGTSVGLNIGNASIKVVELQSKGGNVTVTGLGSVPTPAESISNGVVMSVDALRHAIREAFKVAGIKSKRVTISVSGTGALVVRVIEVPRMSDTELAASMAQDAERYIPFPPSEVIMDYKALRELPAAPDSPNMDVLLAAAQREIIDQNLQVLDGAKLDPRAIEVEPLAVARALSYAQVDADGRPAQSIDYARVTAVINIGASGTEISVLRGDVLVFTRIIPNGGNTLTQALVDYLGLPFPDAERTKHELGDALASYQPAVAGYGAAPASSSGDDWSDFGADDFGASDPATNSGTVNTATTSSDPFDEDFFNQGPQNTQNEPREQHGQKQTPDENEDKDTQAFSFDFQDIAFDNPNEATTTPSTSANTDESVESAPASAFDLSFADEPSPVEPTVAETATASTSDTETPVTEAASSAPASDFNFDLDAPATTPAASAFSFDFDTPSEPTPVAPPTAATPISETVPGALTPEPMPATEPSAWSLGDLGLPDDEPAATSTAASLNPDAFDLPATTPIVESATPVGDANDLNFDDLFGTDTPEVAPATVPADTSSSTDFSDFGVPVEDAALLGAGAVGAGAMGAGAVSNNAAANDFGAGMDDFGGGFGDDMSPHVDAATVYSILHPLLDELAGEIRRSLEYHASRYPDAVVQSIDVVGGGARLTNIDVYLTQMLGIPTTVGNPFRTMSLKNSAAAADAPTYAVATGLALRDLLA